MSGAQVHNDGIWVLKWDPAEDARDLWSWGMERVCEDLPTGPFDRLVAQLAGQPD